MDTGRDAVRDVVELRYRPEAADFSSALRARLRAGRGAWVYRWLLPVMVGAVIAAEVVGVAAGTGGLPPFVLMAAVGLAVALPLTPWLQARAFQRLAEWQGEFRATVTDRGTTVATAHTTVAADWVAQPRYRETDRVFVLLSADRNATGLTVLPKRGLAGPADADRLRALLDRHLTRC